MHSVMDIMDNYPECTTQPHSCLQLRPKQLPPPLHPSSSLQWRLLTAFWRSWYLPDINKTRALEEWSGRKIQQMLHVPRLQGTDGTEPSWMKTVYIRSSWSAWGFQGGVERSTSWRNRSGPISWERLKAATGLSRDLDTWHLWAFWINISFCIK